MDIRGPLFDRTLNGHDLEPQGRTAGADSIHRSSRSTAVPQPEDSRPSPPRAIAQLAVQLRDIPDVREEVLAQVAERLATGYYLSAEAAKQTAEVMIRDPFSTLDMRTSDDVPLEFKDEQ